MLSFFTGALDVAYMGISPTLLGHTYHLPLKLIAVANAHAGSLAVVGPRDARPEGAPKIGMVLGSDAHVLAHHFTQSDRLPAKALFVNLSPEESLHALTTGMIDFAALWEPHVSMALETGASIVFSDRDLDFEIYSFIVASERAVREKREALSRLVAAHLAAVEQVERDVDLHLARLRMVFGPSVSHARYGDVLRDTYRWPRMSFLEEGLDHDVLRSLQGVRDAHIALGTAGTDHSIDSLIPSPTPARSSDPGTPLNLGYSNSIMCTTFHVADFGGLFEQEGMQIDSGRRRVEERIARLSPEFQDDLRLCHELLARDPGLVIQKLGRMNEALFSDLAHRMLGISDQSFAAVLKSIREAELVPRDMVSWADSIRSIRNVATHDGAVLTAEEAGNAFSILLNIVEWFERERASFEQTPERCPQCRMTVQDGWHACPQCGASLSPTCAACGEPLDPAWRVCPHCAEPRERAAPPPRS